MSWQHWHISRSNSSIGFNHLSSGKCPARSTRSLVLHIRYHSRISPVNWLRKVLKLKCINVNSGKILFKIMSENLLQYFFYIKKERMHKKTDTSTLTLVVLFKWLRGCGVLLYPPRYWALNSSCVRSVNWFTPLIKST